MSMMLQQKRATRGQRMNELVGEALDQDNTFYGHDTWDEEESDSSFSEEEVKPDVFDSDFNDTEDDDDSDDDSEEEKTRKAERTAGKAGTTSGGKYKEPTRPKTIAKPRDPSAPKAQRKSHIDKSAILLLGSDRGIRASTQTKSVNAEKIRKMKNEQRAKRAAPRMCVKHQFTQKELLLDALSTEENNDKWLRKQKELSKDAGGGGVKKKLGIGGNVIRFVSRRGTYDTVTFTEVESMPTFLRHQNPPTIPEKLCKITGQLAKYRDPVTGFPYANIEALREIKRKFHKMES